MTKSVLARAAELERAGEPFALATVVWRRGPSSGQIAAKALVLPDGTLDGWLGGACAQPAVQREAATALTDGRARLLLLGLPREASEMFGDDAVTVPMECGSEGALAVYIEPVVPVPQVIAVGETPAVSLLVDLATDLGWRAAAVPSGDALADRTIDPGTAIVVATQGHDDEAAVAAALETDAGYVGLVASAKRAETVLGYLRDRGVPDESVARVTAPAGVDLGHTGHREIAVAVLAELVAKRAAGGLLRPVRSAAAEPPVEAVDPICGMTVDVATARWTTERDGQVWYFCSPGCRHRFENESATHSAHPE
ncbi:MAG TPA: XdhC family protein [Jiangellaceae bacterium]